MKRLPLVLLCLIPAFASGPATADHSVRTSGMCTEYGTGILVDVAKAQAAVPDPFVVLDIGGKALVSVFAERCTTSVNGGPAQTSVISGVFVFLDLSGVNPAGCQSYDWAWQDSLDSAWVAANRSLGWSMEVLPSSFAETDMGFEMAVPSQLASWSAKPVAGGVPSGELPFTSIHCTMGPRGIVRGTFDHHMIELGSGAGAVTLGPGRLWERLGATTHDAMPGLVATFTWEGVTEIVPA